VNFSSLKHMARGANYYKWAQGHKRKPTAAMQKGTAVHCMVLEPEQFPERYAIIDLNRNGKAFKEQAALEAEAGREIIKTAEYAEICAIAEGVKRNPTAMDLLKGTETEVSLTWNMHGHDCKGRVDAIKPGKVIDLKTTADPQPWKFGRQAGDMLYHAQMAFYAAGVASKQGNYPEAWIIAVGNSAPYECICYRVPMEALVAGEDLYTNWLTELEQCREGKRFPSKYEGVQELELPGYMLKAETETRLIIEGEDFTV